MQEVKINKYKGSKLLKFAVIAFVLYILYLIIFQQLEVSAKKAELKELQEDKANQEMVIEEIQYTLNKLEGGQDDFVEEYARSELDYAKQGERVFVNIGGN